MKNMTIYLDALRYKKKIATLEKRNLADTIRMEYENCNNGKINKLIINCINKLIKLIP